MNLKFEQILVPTTVTALERNYGQGSGKAGRQLTSAVVILNDSHISLTIDFKINELKITISGDNSRVGFTTLKEWQVGGASRRECH